MTPKVVLPLLARLDMLPRSTMEEQSAATMQRIRRESARLKAEAANALADKAPGGDSSGEGSNLEMVGGHYRYR